MNDNELDAYPYRPADPPWWPGDESGYQEYHRQLYRIGRETGGFVRWKVLSTGMNIARQFAGARNRGRDQWMQEHGSDPAGWPLAHPPVVLWIAVLSQAACLRCMWLGRHAGEPSRAAADARIHTAKFLTASDATAFDLLFSPVAVWSHPDDPGRPKYAP